MKRLASYLFCVVFLPLLSAPYPSRAQEATKEFVERLRPAVVTIICYDKSGKPTHQGSGFLYKSERRLITNYHVLGGDVAMARIKTSDGKEYNVRSVEAEDKTCDLLEAEVDIPYNKAKYLSPAGAAPAPGDRVIVVGSPLGVENTVSEGNIRDFREIPGRGMMMVYSAHSYHGSSGSPVVNARGEVTGVVSAGIPGMPDMNFAVPVDRIEKLSRAPRRMAVKQAAADDDGRDSESGTAVEEYKRLASEGDPNAQVNLAILYEQGRGVSRSLCEAYDLFREPADQGFTPAIYHVGRMFLEGKCVTQNPTEAVKWFRKAADRGYADAQCALGVLHFNGEGVPRDRVQGCMWVILAASRQNANAMKRLRLFSAELTPEEMRQARDAAQKWKPAGAR